MRLGPESTYPLIILPEPVTIVQAVQTDRVMVVRVVEDLIEPKVCVEFLVGDDPFPRTCVVLEGENYFAEWDDATITDAVTAHLHQSS